MQNALLYKGFEYKPVIPYKKHVFYRNVYDALFDDHDLSKGDSFSRPKKTNLDIEEFHRILRMLGFLSLQENEIEFEKDKLLLLISKSIESQLSKSVSTNDLLDDLHVAIPLFIEIGSKYKWSHKSFMEYFAAKFIEIDSKNDQKDILLAILNSERNYYNLLELYHDIDYPNFESIILYNIACQFLEHFNNSYKICGSEMYVEQEVVSRKEITFRKKYFLFKSVTRKQFHEDGKIFVNFHQKYNITSLGLTPYFLIGTEDDEDNYEAILSILINRKSTLVNKNETLKNSEAKKVKALLVIHPEITINDTIDNIANSPEYFALITNSLKSSPFGNFSFNHREILRLKEKIDANRNNSNKTSLTRGL